VQSLSQNVFDLTAHPAKAAPALVAGDEAHLSEVASALARTVRELTSRLDAARLAPAGSGQVVLDRDQEVHRLTARLRTLQRFGVDLCLGRMVPAGGGEPLYVGRLGLLDADGRPLLLDWRSPAAGPFFAATHGDPMGLASRRRYRWTAGRVSDYWDEVFTPEGMTDPAALDDQSAFIAGLGSHRSSRMRDVLATIQSDQDAAIRAGSRGALVVDGGPGTGKTVVALHRAAYLLYSDPRLGHRRGGVLFVGPSRPYLDYVADVLPSLGEEGVQTCTVRDLVVEGAAAAPEADPEVARLKAQARMVTAVEPAIRLYEEPPTGVFDVETPWGSAVLDAGDWTDAFRAPDPGTPHNEARDQIWDELAAVVRDRLDDPEDPTLEQVRAALRADAGLADALNRAWPLLDPAELVGDLWSVPAYLRRCAPWLDPGEVRLLQRADAQAWTTSDLPLLDAARQRLGDPAASRRQRRKQDAARAARAEMDRVVEHLIETHDTEMRVMSMLRGQDLQEALVDESAAPTATADLLAGPFAHVVVDEAQELTDAEWQMLLVRCPSRSLTVVGDRSQARHGFTETWRERLGRVGLARVEVAHLSVNYRTPQEVMAEAEPVIRAVIPDANVPTSVRSTGVPVARGRVADRDGVLDRWLTAHAEGTACVVGDPAFRSTSRVASLSPELVKGLEFDLVVLVEPDAFGAGVEGAVDRYVAMTRATQQLVVLTG